MMNNFFNKLSLYGETAKRGWLDSNSKGALAAVFALSALDIYMGSYALAGSESSFPIAASAVVSAGVWTIGAGIVYLHDMGVEHSRSDAQKSPPIHNRP
jgi:hypothetical protein